MAYFKLSMVNVDDAKKASPGEFKKSVEGTFPILSVEAMGQVIPNLSPWKKSSQTYQHLSKGLFDSVADDLECGVRAFFIEANALGSKAAYAVVQMLESHPDAKDIRLIITGSNTELKSSTLKFVSESRTLNALSIARDGGNHVLELAKLTIDLIRWADRNPVATDLSVMISTDEHFFQSIAKIRAFREIAEKIFRELDRKVSVAVISRVNIRGWTLYDRYNNMLRNTASVGAALVGGADVIQSLGYMAPFELEVADLEKDPAEAIHLERSRRMARNTTHILSLESMLGMVQDAAAGSYHLEMLTEKFSSEAWTLMQKWIALDESQAKIAIQTEVEGVREERSLHFHTRKFVMSGINDFPNVAERLNLKSALPVKNFRLARSFEELRLRVERLSPNKKREVRIIFWGDYARLNARLNFTKNYFELLGLKVHDPLHTVDNDPQLAAWVKQGNSNEILALCASDDDYAELAKKVQPSVIANFVAGKGQIAHFESIYAGQNVFDILKKLVEAMEASS